MENKELQYRLQIELDMLKILLTETRDQETLDLLLDRFIEVKRVLSQIEKDIENDKNSALWYMILWIRPKKWRLT